MDLICIAIIKLKNIKINELNQEKNQEVVALLFGPQEEELPIMQ